MQLAKSANALYSSLLGSESKEAIRFVRPRVVKGPRAYTYAMDCFLSGLAEKTPLHTHYIFRDQLQ